MTKKYAEGCSIGMEMDMTAEDAETIISEMKLRWYGFERDMGNAATRDIIDDLEARTVVWEAERKKLLDAGVGQENVKPAPQKRQPKY